MTNTHGTKNFCIVLGPGTDLLDIAPSVTVFTLLGGTIHFAWKETRPVPSFHGPLVTPTVGFDDCPRTLDALVVPNMTAPLDDPKLVRFLREVEQTTRYVTAVCDGSIYLAAAGLLEGYRVASNPHVVELLRSAGAVASEELLTVDRNRITCRGGIYGHRHALRLAELLVPAQAGALTAMLTQGAEPLEPISGSPLDIAHLAEELTAHAQRRAVEMDRARALTGRA